LAAFKISLKKHLSHIPRTYVPIPKLQPFDLFIISSDSRTLCHALDTLRTSSSTSHTAFGTVASINLK
jgi:hypothetical protein